MPCIGAEEEPRARIDESDSLGADGGAREVWSEGKSRDRGSVVGEKGGRGERGGRR